MVGQGEKGFILAVDVGTTEVSCHLVDHAANVKAAARRKISRLYPAEGRVEVDPITLYQQVKDCICTVIQDAQIDAHEGIAMGICAQRNSILTWDRNTGKPFHNFVCWNDKRASALCKQHNQSWTLKFLRIGSTCLHFVTRLTRFFSGSILRFVGSMVTMRLLWLIQNNSQLTKAIAEHRAMYGCIESWLLYNLTGGSSYDTDISLASSTGMFDPYMLDWNLPLNKLFGVPCDLLPKFRNSCFEFGYCDAAIFGAEIPICALSGDQQAAMFGCGCFERGSAKITLGTGSFLDLNCAQTPHASMKGIFPLVGWKLCDDSPVVYMAEGQSYDTGLCIDWAQSIGLFDDVSETSDLALSVDSTDGVYFVPAFSGLQAPHENDSACACFIGLKATSTKKHMLRAVLESVAYRMVEIIDVAKNEINYAKGPFRVCGGVSQNDFVCQLMADLSNEQIIRMQSHEMSMYGIAFMAGLQKGFWKDQDEIRNLIKVGKVFYPCNEERRQELRVIYGQWQRAVQRAMNWYLQ